MKKFDELMSVGNEIENITAEDAKQKLNDSNVQFIDVRDKESFSNEEMPYTWTEDCLNFI